MAHLPAPVQAARGPASRISARTWVAPVILNLTFQLLDQRLKLCDKGHFLGHHGLFVLARSALDPCLKLRGFQRRFLGGKGLHHLGWQVWKLAEIEGLRHAHFYPNRDRKANKTTSKTAA
jgi:hypothetical protein